MSESFLVVVSIPRSILVHRMAQKLTPDFFLQSRTTSTIGSSAWKILSCRIVPKSGPPSLPFRAGGQPMPQASGYGNMPVAVANGQQSVAENGEQPNKVNEQGKKFAKVLEEVAAEVGSNTIQAGMLRCFPCRPVSLTDLVLYDIVAIAYVMQKMPYVFPIRWTSPSLSRRSISRRSRTPCRSHRDSPTMLLCVP